MVAGPELPDGVLFFVCAPRERFCVGSSRGIVFSVACEACGRVCLYGSIDRAVASRLGRLRGLPVQSVCFPCFSGSRFYDGPASVVRASDVPFEK